MRKIALFAAALLCVAAGPFATGTASASTADSTVGSTATSGVVPPQARVNGATYGQWSATWWQWAFSTRVHTGTAITHPLLATGDVDCTIGQNGHVWFLGGNFNGQPGNALSRTCTVPTGTFLFTPITNAWADNSNCDGDPPLTSTTDELRGIVRDSVNNATALSVSLDGRPVNGIRSAASPYRATSPVFSYTTPADSLINYSFCPFRAQHVHGAVADGVYVMLFPLAVGLHTLRWTVSAGDKLVLDVVYHLTARHLPRHRTSTTTSPPGETLSVFEIVIGAVRAPPDSSDLEASPCRESSGTRPGRCWAVHTEDHRILRGIPAQGLPLTKLSAKEI